MNTQPIETQVFVKDRVSTIRALENGCIDVATKREYILAIRDMASSKMHIKMGSTYVSYCDYQGNNEAASIYEYRELVPKHGN